MMRPRPLAPRIYTVPPGTPFLVALARALLAGDLPRPGGAKPAPLDLADMTLLLPTRRATRALQEAFLQCANGAAVLLPKIKPISQALEDQDLLASGDDFGLATTLSLGRVITGLERQLVLTALVLRWSHRQAPREGDPYGAEPSPAAAARTPAQAAKLATELGRLMDLLELQRVGPEKIAALVPETYSEHWARTLKFLEIVTDFWPKHLRANASASPMQWRNHLMRAETKRLETGSKAPVIVAGVTGTDPAASQLMAAVAGLSNGAIVLPGLDQSLGEDGWAAIGNHPEHPQYGLKKLLAALKVERGDVVALPGVRQSSIQRARSTLVGEAMRPATTTQTWHHFTAGACQLEMAKALQAITILEAPIAEDEAEAIALILRHVARAPAETAALVTPDRQLARRVSVRLQCWDLRVDDCAGRPFANTLPGVFLDLAVQAIASRFSPLALVTLLKHWLCRLGLDRAELRQGVHTLEIAALRAPNGGQDLEGIGAALTKAQNETWRHPAARRLTADDWQAARQVLGRVGKAFAPLAALFQSAEPASLATLVKAHSDVAQALAADGQGDASALWQGEAGTWATQVFASLLNEEAIAPVMVATDYPEFYRTLVAEKSIRSGAPTHPRLFIWDPFEARLQLPDVVVLGSLNEGAWPQSVDPGPWLNRPMRQALGLPAPEERIGAAAHDLTSLLGANSVYLTRAAKIDGVPTVPSRWLLRLQALIAGLGQGLAPRPPWLAWSQARIAIDGRPRPVKAPAPRPPVRLRPRQLSVTAIETWLANPYAVFAQRILRLEPLPPLGALPDAALRGQIVHEALSRFARAFPDRLPQHIASELADFAATALAEFIGSPRVAAFWAPRFARFAAWFAETERGRRQGTRRTITEVDGKLQLPGPAGPFALTARADRIDIGDGGVVITDYKTGANLQALARRALTGEAPQLALEAAIAAAGGFTHIGAGRVAGLRYISASGGEPPGQEFDLKTDDLGMLGARARDGLVRLIAEFDRQETPYRALRRARFNYDYDDYAHLARVGEWSADRGEEA